MNNARIAARLSPAWQARRWYYTPKSRRAYSIRQVSPGDRRLLAEFVSELTATSAERDLASIRELTTMLFDRVIVNGEENAVAFAALENTSGADRVIGVCAYAPSGLEGADFGVAVANSYREEQVGRTLLSTLIRHAKRVGVRRLSGEMVWSNRAMQTLATSLGFQVLPLQRDRNYRLLALDLK
ncbi:MAG TPA: GNAT family N-acetyltransferase [Steroidobacteraceae bacterium]|nr:GNAT family N-acetyltransferase [Steroidobacteraceae bacterium]